MSQIPKNKRIELMTVNIIKKITLSDEELMVLYQRGDYSAFEELFKRHSKKVNGYILKKVNDSGLAEDIFQECFIKLHRNRSKYDTSLPLLPWLFTICRNVLIDYSRKGKLLLVKSNIEEVPQNILDYVNSEEIKAALKKIEVRDASIINLHYFHGYTFDEIAASLKMQSSNVRKIASRTIQKLKLLWEA